MNLSPGSCVPLAMDRRRFMLLAVATLATATSLRSREPRLLAGDLDLGFSLYGMPDVSIDRAIHACSAIGYTNVELAILPGYPTAEDSFDASKRVLVRRSLAETGLLISSLLINLSLIGDDERHRRSLNSIRFANEIAGDLAQGQKPVLQTVFGGKPADTESQHVRSVERLQEWDALAAELDVTIAAKAHVSTTVGTPGQLLHLLREAGTTRIAVAFDQSHYTLAGIPLEESFPPLAPLVQFVHLKDAAGDPDNVQFLLPGQGQADFRQLFASLRHHGYRGPVVVEVSRQIFSRLGYNGIATASQCYNLLAPLVRT